MKASWVCVISFATTAAAGAQDRVSLDALMQEALAAHPRVAAAERRAEAAAMRVAQARSLPDPMMSVGYTSVGKPWPGAGLGVDPNATIGMMVTQELPYPGKRDLAGRIAARAADAERQLRLGNRCAASPCGRR